MPLYKLFPHSKGTCTVAIWRITESEEELMAPLFAGDVLLVEARERFKAASRRLEWLSVRRLMHELALKAGEGYQGYLGVDMMICRTTGGYALHPCVEINWRMNMGVVSRIFFNRYVCPEVTGRYVIEYYPNSGDALKSHEEMKANNPLCLDGGKISEGYLSLTPVFEDTNYQIYVLMMKK